MLGIVKLTTPSRGCSIGWKLVGYEHHWRTAPLPEKLPHQLEGRRLVPLWLDQKFQDLAIGIDSALEIHLPSADRYENLVEVPPVIWSWPEALRSPRVAASELEHAPSDGLVRDLEAAFGQQILHVTEAECEAAAETGGVLDDLGRKAMAAIRDWFHPKKLSRPRSNEMPINVTVAFWEPG